MSGVLLYLDPCSTHRPPVLLPLAVHRRPGCVSHSLPADQSHTTPHHTTTPQGNHTTPAGDDPLSSGLLLPPLLAFAPLLKQIKLPPPRLRRQQHNKRPRPAHTLGPSERTTLVVDVVAVSPFSRGGGVVVVCHLGLDLEPGACSRQAACSGGVPCVQNRYTPHPHGGLFLISVWWGLCVCVRMRQRSCLVRLSHTQQQTAGDDRSTIDPFPPLWAPCCSPASGSVRTPELLPCCGCPTLSNSLEADKRYGVDNKTAGCSTSRGKQADQIRFRCDLLRSNTTHDSTRRIQQYCSKITQDSNKEKIILL